MAAIYCFKCKEKQEARDLQQVMMKNGKPATRGICTVCGGAVSKIGAPA